MYVNLRGMEHVYIMMLKIVALYLTLRRWREWVSLSFKITKNSESLIQASFNQAVIKCSQ